MKPTNFSFNDVKTSLATESEGHSSHTSSSRFLQSFEGWADGSYSDRLSDIGCGGRVKAAVCRWFPCLTSYPRASPAELHRHKSETDKSVFRSLLDTLLKQKTLFLWKQSRCYHVSSVLERDWMLERQACMTPFSLVNEQLQRFPLQILHQWWQSELWNQMTIVFPSSQPAIELPLKYAFNPHFAPVMLWSTAESSVCAPGCWPNWVGRKASSICAWITARSASQC